MSIPKPGPGDRILEERRAIKERRVLIISIAVFVCGVLSVPAYMLYQAIETQNAVNRIVGCLAIKGKPVSEDTVRGWMTDFRNKYGKSNSDTIMVTEYPACGLR